MNAILSEFTLTGFKSYRESHLPLGSLTILIGANASGKSNAIEGLRFLSWLAQGQKLSSIQYETNNGDRIIRGRTSDLCYRGESSFSLGCRLDATTWNDLTITLSVRDGELHINHEKITETPTNVPLYEIDKPSLGFGTDVSVAYNNFMKGRNKPRIICSDQMAIFVQLDSPASFAKKHAQSQKAIPNIVQRYQQVLGNILFLDPIPAKMREYSFKTDRHLQGDGTNLSSVLYHLWHDSEDNQQAILNFIQSLPEQKIAGVSFLSGPRDEVMIKLTETFGKTQRDYEAALLSDGTLRVLAIAAAMLSATEGSLVVIEEIDNGVHSTRAQHLVSKIRAVADQRNLRVLLSTHNPALMDALPDDALSDVVFCFRDPETGDSRLIRLGDLDEFPGLVSQGSLGHLVTAGIVDRVVKSPETPEDRRQKAMHWLSQLQR